MEKNKWVIGILLAIMLCVSGFREGLAAVPPELDADAAILIDTLSGQIFFANNTQKKMPPASTKSGNDAAAAIAEYLGGSEPFFVELMNRKAVLLGARRSRFKNPHGLPAPGQKKTYCL